MASEKGLEFISKYKGTDVLKETWLVMFRKGHITLDELAECIELTGEEIQALKDEQIDNCSKEIKTNEQLQNELLETQKMLLDLQEQVIDIIINS